MSGSSVPTNQVPYAVGQVLLGKYKVVGQVGSGGMGVVMAADHIALRTRVAIKFLLPQFAGNPDVVERFVREARAASKIKSEHIPQVFDVGTLENGLPFIVMEHLAGSDLDQELQRKGPLKVGDAVDCIIQAADALDQAHRMGIVHRDVKPANLFRAKSSDGTTRIKVLDFGISKFAEEAMGDLSLTKTTAVLGSGLYMSPEQMKSARSVDHRSDIYALGVCLYELLSRTHPFTAESFPELCVKVNISESTPIASHCPDLPPGLAQVIHRAFAREVNDRFSNMAELAVALAPYSGGRSLAALESLGQRAGVELPLLEISRGSMSSLRVGPPTTTPPKIRTGAAAAMAAGAVGMGLLAAAAGIWLVRSRSTETTPISPEASVAAPLPSPPSALTPVVSAAEPSAALPSAPSASSNVASATMSAATKPKPRIQGKPTGPKLCSKRNPVTGLKDLVPCK